MKINMPVTDHEVQYEDDTLIVSKTDLKGMITFVNRDFIRISGFTEAELIGKNHNMVRHPDMPPAAFADFWATLKAGKPWVGMVKNRCKNGDYYWVEANATPIMESGQITGYLSVRVKPTRAQIEQAEALYRAIRENRAGNIKIQEGQVVKTGLLHKLNVLKLIHQRTSMATKFALIGLILAIPMLLATSLLGLKYQDDIKVAQQERVGLAFHKDLRLVLTELQKHRGLNGLALTGDADAKRKIQEIESNLSTLMQKLDKVAPQQNNAAIDQDWQALHKNWQGLLKDLPSLEGSQAFAHHTEIIESLMSLMGNAANASGLVLDPEAASFHIMNAAILNAPDLAEHMGYSRGYGAQMVARNNVSNEAKLTLMKSLIGAVAHRETIESALAYAIQARPDLEPSIGQLGKTLHESVSNFDKLANEKVVYPSKLEISGTDFFAAGTLAVDATYAFYDKAVDVLDQLLVERIANTKHNAYTLLSFTLALFLLGALIAYLFVRDTCQSLQLSVNRFWEIASGNFKGEVRAKTNDEIGQLMRGLKSMQTKLGFDINDTRERAEAALRLKIGLDSTTTNVMIADNDRNLIYMNPSVIAMLRTAQDDLRKELPHFDVNKLLGAKIDVFHKNPEHQARLLATFTSTYRATIKVGGRTFALTANPVINERGERLGSVIEWIDRTLEVAVEEEVNTIVNAAAAGDFSQRIDENNKEGFFKLLANGINKVVATSDAGLKDIARVLSALAKGDLTESIDADYQGTFADLKDYTNETVRSLETMLRDIRDSAESIHTASSEIASGNADLSSRTEEQASSLEETASSMEEFTSTVRQNADNASEANKLASGASDVATRGGEVVSSVVMTMGAINDSARKIVDIISVIDGIAFQTNILALNAAVEAARAGEQGRGFAVVAAEVRNLAQRSAAAAKEIKGLINNSVEKTEDGNRLVEQAGKTMEEVVDAIQHVTNIMSEITTASMEQTSGIEQVSTAINQMDEVTQQNAALVEEAAAAAESMSDQAATLLEIVKRFKLNDSMVYETKKTRAALSTSHKKLAPLAHAPKSVPKQLGKQQKPDDDDWQEF